MLNPDQLQSVVAKIHELCAAKALVEMTDRINKLKELAAELCNQSTGAKRLSIEDLCLAASQDSGLSHPAILTAVAARSDELVSHFIANAVAEAIDLKAKRRAA